MIAIGRTAQGMFNTPPGSMMHITVTSPTPLRNKRRVVIRVQMKVFDDLHHHFPVPTIIMMNK